LFFYLSFCFFFLFFVFGVFCFFFFSTLTTQVLTPDIPDEKRQDKIIKRTINRIS